MSRLETLTMAELRIELDIAVRGYEAAQYIDHYPDMRRERERWAKRMADLTDEIDRREKKG